MLIAGSNWNNGANCGSRSRNLNNWTWNANTNIGSHALIHENSQTSWLNYLPCSLGFLRSKIQSEGGDRIVSRNTEIPISSKY